MGANRVERPRWQNDVGNTSQNKVLCSPPCFLDVVINVTQYKSLQKMENQNEKQKEILKNESEKEAARIREIGRKFLQELKAKGPNEENVGKTFVIQTRNTNHNAGGLSQSFSENGEKEPGLSTSKRRELMKLRIDTIKEISENDSCN